MQKYTVSLPGTTSAVTHYLPIPDAGKIVEVHAVVNANQGDTAGRGVTIGKAGADHTIFTASTVSKNAGDIVKGVLTTGVTDAEKAQLFGNGVPIAVGIQLHTAAEVGLTILVDEYGINGLRP